MSERRIIVDHVLLVVEDLDASRRLYTAAIAPLGYVELHVQEDAVHYGAYVDDLRGNNVEAVWHAPEAVRDAPIRRGVP
jgi:catechol 2,3-dioxygenase-like lactoylglutathione lyase family enzyme